MKKRHIKTLLALTTAAMMLALTACGGSSGTATSASSAAEEEAEDEAEADADAEEAEESSTTTTAQAGDSAPGKTYLADDSFDTSYQPKKDEYKIYMTYKLIHSWYDSIRVGVDAAVADLAEKGVTIDYVWEAPAEPDAIDQVNRMETAAGQDWDILMIDINEPATSAQAINNAVAAGKLVGVFGGADVESDRLFFVGNTDNYGDGAALAKAVCEAMDGKGQIALLAGTIGASSHEDRLQAFKDVIAEYPDIEIVDEQRDNDQVERAISITETWLQAYPDLGGILANNMANPVGAAQAVKDAGKSGEIAIGGMDHDLRTLEALQDGTLTIAQVQNCYDMGYKAIWYAVMAVDGEDVPDSTPVGSTSVYQEDAQRFIDMLYGE